MRGAVIIEFRDGARRLRAKRRDHVLDQMARARVGSITDRQRTAGLKLFEAWCNTLRSPDSAFTRVCVDVSGRPDDAAVMKCERGFAFADLAQHVPRGCRSVVDHVVLCNLGFQEGNEVKPPLAKGSRGAERELQRLRYALDALVKALGL